MSRTVGRIPDAGGLAAGDHACWIYQDDDDHRSGLTTYFSEGFDAGQRLVYLADRYHGGEIQAYLADAGLPVGALLHEDRLRILPAREGYPMNGDELDLQKATTQFRAMADEAVADGHTGLRVAGECGFLLDAGRVPLLAYELACDMMVRDAPLTAMCLYDGLRDPVDRLGEIAAVHAAAIVAASAASEVPTYRIWASEDNAIALGGEIDLATSQVIQDVLMQSAVGRSAVLDLSEVEFADVSAIRAITRIAAAMAGPQDRPVIRGASPLQRFVLAQFDATRFLFDG